MKQTNPFLPALLAFAIVALIAGVVALLISASAPSYDEGTHAAAGAFAAFAIPLGGVSFPLWIAASAIAWRPTDVEPAEPDEAAS